MQITNYSYQVQRNQQSSSSAELTNSAASPFTPDQSGVAEATSQTPISGVSAGQYAIGLTLAQAAPLMANPNGGLNMDSFLTASDLNLIQKTTGQTMVPSLHGQAKFYDANGQEVQPSAATGQLVGTLQFMRASGGVNNGDNQWQPIAGDTAITSADFQDFAKQYAGTFLAVSDTLLNQVSSVLNMQQANSKNA
jgi:hypothetical protein